jgi:chromosome segregation protein
MKYNIRKNEALNKLESSRVNLQRLQDIINEVKRQINSIDRYAKRAEKYKRLFDEIKSIEIKISLRDVISMEEDLGKLAGTESSHKIRETELSTQIHSSDAIIAEKKLFFVEKEKSLEEIQNRLNIMEREFIEEEGKISLSRSYCENLKGRLERLKLREEEIEKARESFNIQIREIEQKKSYFSSEFLTVEKAVETQRNEIVDLEKEISELEKDIELKRKDIFRKTDEFSNIRNELNSLSLIRESLEKKEKKNVDEIGDTRDILTSIALVIQEAQAIYNKMGNEMKEMYTLKKNIADDIKMKKENLSQVESSLYRDREELAAMNSRKESLKELDRKGKSAVKDSVKVLCQVADIFETRQEYETAIEAVLGDRLNASIVDNHTEIKKALQLIKDRKINRSGFIPLNISPLSVLPVPSHKGVVGKAIDFVKVREGFNKIAFTLLDDVIIVNELDTAFDLWNKAHTSTERRPDYRCFVTLDGEVLEHPGVVSGGIEKGVLKIKREIRELKKGIETKKSRIASAEKELSLLRESLESLENKLYSLEGEISQKEKVRHEHQVKISAMQEEDSQYNKRLDFLTSEIEEDKKEKDIANQTLNQKQKICETLEHEKRSLEEETKSLQQEYSSKKSGLESLRSEHTDKRMSITSLKEKIDSMERESKRLDSEIIDMKKKREHMSAEYQTIEKDIDQREEEIQKMQDNLKSSVVSISSLKEDSLNLREILEAQSAELKLMEKQQKEYTDELTSVRRELSRIEVKKTELSLGLIHIKENIKNIYSINLDSIPEEERLTLQLTPEEEEKLKTLREKLKEIGPVNLGTLEELKELKTRYDFLKKQQDDLLQSIESLQETISKINRTTKKKLSDAYEALNEKFKEVFTVLFGKGKAELILTEEDILEAGIDIVAQPPGKKLQNLMLLSGGEKALTALSLLFAGFMIKPTPLCLLDEVDAPLDESNTDRFTSLLTELAKNIQFIIITHNRRTMEVADYLYGVTMEEPGISKTVSMHLTEAV